MLSVSKKSIKMPASPIRKLVPFADEAKKRGVKVHHLNIGQPDIASPLASIDSLRNFSQEVIAYTHSEGTLEYRSLLAEYYQGRGIDLNAENFVTTQGGSEALLFTFGIIANPGDEIIIPEPYYANYNGFTQQNEVVIVPVQTSINTGFDLPSIEDFEEKITERTKAILICNPGNPTGYVYTKSELEKLKDLVLRYNIYLISDEVYAEYLYTEEEFTSVLSFPDLENNAIIIDSESKRFSLCGIRLGSLVTRNKSILEAALRFAQARLSPSSVGQHIAIHAHLNHGSYFEDSRNEYRQRRDVLVDGLNDIPGVKCPKPKGAFYCFAELPVDDSEEFCVWLLNEFEYEGETIMMAPGGGFYDDPEDGIKQVRLAYVLNVTDLKKSVEILRLALEAYPGVSR